ncbi:hypothetical protein MMC07_002002 [Pseudocyphellaria aurata]|nr:hypothetical protein [Pseudocyphellaria aurata]
MASAALPSLPESDAAKSRRFLPTGLTWRPPTQRRFKGTLKDLRLWDAIQADFEDFQEEHFKMIDGSTWDLIKAYCYTHGYWLDHKYGPWKIACHNHA